MNICLMATHDNQFLIERRIKKLFNINVNNYKCRVKVA